MKSIVLYFQVHQPRRLRPYSYFEIGTGAPYFNDDLDKKIIQRIARDCYLPANRILLDLVRQNPEIRIAFSISGMAIRQFEQYVPEVIESFRQLGATQSVEFLGETNYHTLASEMSGREFEDQVVAHSQKMNDLFNVTPKTFRNTELVYSNEVAQRVAALGFNVVLAEGVSSVLHGKHAGQVFESRQMKVLLRNYRLSDEIGFRYRQDDSVLTTERFLSYIDSLPENENTIVVGLDYETFGEHQKKQTGILDFFRKLIEDIDRHPRLRFATPCDLTHEPSCGILDVQDPIAWADESKDLSAWLGNNMQREAFDLIQKFGKDVLELRDEALLDTWRCLQTSDHFYYMSTKKHGDGAVHSYFSPYSSPYEAFVNYMNVLSDFEILITSKKSELKAEKDPRVEAERERRDSLEPIWVEPLKEEYHAH